MEKEITRKSLMDVLKYCGISDLPETWDGKSVWIRAIAKVKKMDGSICYVVARRGKNGVPTVLKDFGSSACIFKIEGIHPYIFLYERFMPNMKGKSKEAKIEYLVSNAGMKDAEALGEKSIKEIDDLIIQHAIKLQMECNE